MVSCRLTEKSELAGSSLSRGDALFECDLYIIKAFYLCNGVFVVLRQGFCVGLAVLELTL